MKGESIEITKIGIKKRVALTDEEPRKVSNALNHALHVSRRPAKSRESVCSIDVRAEGLR